VNGSNSLAETTARVACLAASLLATEAALLVATTEATLTALGAVPGDAVLVRNNDF